MALPFDATLKDLVQTYLPDYERTLGLTDVGPLRPLNVDLSTISAATDNALGHGDPPDRTVDLNCTIKAVLVTVSWISGTRWCACGAGRRGATWKGAWAPCPWPRCATWGPANR